MRSWLPASLAAAWLASSPATALAGMPSVNLSDVARLRFQTISFFLIGLLVCAALIRLLWNYLRKDFPALPRLSYGKAVGVVVLWGLLFILVLTMISGARELMTPGAWDKQGLTYRLAKDPAPAAATEENGERLRRQMLEDLRLALWEYADSHEGQFPPDRSVAEIAPERWLVSGSARLRYGYAGGRKAGPAEPLAFEPDLYGPERLVLLTNGLVCKMRSEDIERALTARASR